MQDQFVGYLLNALDPATHRQVDRYLAAHPECHEQLELLRQAMQPLDFDREVDDPTPGLAMRTLAHIAEHTSRRLPQAPPEVSRGPAAGRTWWRRSDVLVAASLLLCVLLFTPPVLSHIRREYQVQACKNNLGVMGQALLRYSDLHQGKFPNVADEKPPYNVAGMVVPVLYESGVLSPDCNVQCPGGPPIQPTSLNASQLKDLPHVEFFDKAPFLSGSFAYSLGYRQAGTVQGMRNDGVQPQSLAPLMADAPLWPLSDANSANHGGAGQNVLYMDGHVVFCSNRFVGYDRDDIYCSKAHKIEAGVNRFDAVLGQSSSHP
jgi:prepilin-type processing-associated H-X9-DG protein